MSLTYVDSCLIVEPHQPVARIKVVIREGIRKEETPEEEESSHPATESECGGSDGEV
jgi:hypothetical protein